ncbi:restriction endonuclease subunit S [Turicibacter bilis]|uniref:Restriction endonuclease subunit S n=1 Tax=Turicibacter bilis TaxID=2735723 RepID=A0ABY5JJ48_9FIRM|nr:restriction endonuclease subunit S [Turicibacter bilis]MBS3199855.1 restriction endonuclease subunit S [Turicibacter bilis]UUF06722.1 restriction endonuclease subunit S [Turicibacter bilis]
MTNEELYYLPASELLKHIQAEKERLIKEKAIKKSKPLPPITEEEKPYDLPEGWEWVRLGEYIKDISGGSTPSKQNDLFWNGSIPWASVKDLKDYKYLENTIDRITEHALENTNIKLIPENQLIVCTRVGLGKVLINKIKTTINQDLKAISLINNCSIEYLYYAIKTLSIEGTGTTVKGITQEELLNKIIPLPPLYIQDQIVQKLEQLSETKDSLLSHAESQLNYTKKMREALLQEAIRGELVPQDENDEPASILLEQIKAEKERLIKEKVIKKQKELPPITDEEKPYELPEGWEWVRLGNVAQFNPRNKADNDSLVGFIPMTLISDGFANNHTFETRKWEQVKSGYTHFANDDVIFAKITPCFENRKSTIVKDLPNGIGSGTTEVITLRSYNNTILPGYLLALVNSPEFINGGKLTYLGTAGQQRVNAEFLKNYVFALPPLTEQERIVAKLDELMANCDQLEGKAEEMKTYTTRLFEASLKEAFMPDIEEC